jgi:hypothetical protein
MLLSLSSCQRVSIVSVSAQLHYPLRTPAFALGNYGLTGAQPAWLEFQPFPQPVGYV